jgi:DNA-binding PucR family transcriptional regulator
VLGPLLAHEREHRTHTLQTLHAFFLCGMNRKSTAARLGIHRNTLNYRLESVERLMDVAIASGEASFRIQLALRLIPMSSWATILDITEPGALAPAPGSSA